MTEVDSVSNSSSSSWTSWLTFGYFGDSSTPALGRNVPPEVSSSFLDALKDPANRALFVTTSAEDIQKTRASLRPVGLAFLLGKIPSAPPPVENEYCRGHQYAPGSPMRELHQKIKPHPPSAC